MAKSSAAAGPRRFLGWAVARGIRSDPFFFVSALGQGEHLLRYRLRAEIPGVFHALPTVLYGMYVPELRANSEECLIKIVD
ncbi:MAG: hypothetical protein ISS72_07260 [Candidatus Brocadiae bacterium]|nr:hypothetical protein [Candidatus Brocadiia bacterium]